MSSFKDFQARQQQPRYVCCACGKPFTEDADPQRNRQWDAITCPHCNFRQGLDWAKPGHFTYRTKQVKFAQQHRPMRFK